ncbi:ewing's tumor-associated antigen 1 [Hoplias malabaricus]|uniref:ewing's tumor-associated antigen 1 n=1 Tax=Hoplias malabaricus TaxID=27720 RepID=UPI0034637CD5
MTDRRNVAIRSSVESRETKISELPQNRVKTQRTQARSPKLRSTCQPPKDLETPKRQRRNRFNVCSTGDSPSEAEKSEDIIWDPCSPPPVSNGKGAEGSVQVFEISDIVNRIAPKDERPADRDLVLQWIGDSAVPCTPEIQQPRVRRVSARRQISDVEDLMKLAKQFDINMTRQDEERQLENINTKGLPKPCKSTADHNTVLGGINSSAGNQVSFPFKPKVLSHEEELHALFDGPTQSMSGRLSPPSANGSQESRTEPAAVSVERPDVAHSKKFPDHAAQVPKSDFDDDWENDDLLNDSFVLEMTQNPEILDPVLRKSAPQTLSDTSRKCELKNIASKDCCTPLQSHLSQAQKTSSSTFRPKRNTSVTTGTVPHVPKTSRCEVKPEKGEKHQAQTQKPPDKGQQVVKNMDLQCTEMKIKGSAGAEISDSLDSVWDNGDDDDLLYQVCDDVERLSASQELQQQNSPRNICKSSSPTAPSSVDAVHFSNLSGSTVPSGQFRDQKPPARVFGRSHSIPGASNTYGNQQTSQTGHIAQRIRQYRFTQIKNVPGTVFQPQWKASFEGPSAGSSSDSQHSTFKRHQSDPMPLGNKVFVTAHPVVKCTAAEIERKKQEAIARRRLRLQATQRPKAQI